MKHGSLFSGIGGFDLAAEWMGWENVFHCEREPFAQKVLNHHFPNSKLYEDITTFDATAYAGRIDLLTGGFPCQPFSTAGLRKGTEDERHLWPQMLRIIREIKPRYVLGENVRGLLNWSGGLVFEQVCTDLEAEGYEVTSLLLPAAAVNAPHRRDRIWFIAYSSSCKYSPPRESKGIKKERSKGVKGKEARRVGSKRANGLYGLQRNTPDSKSESSGRELQQGQREGQSRRCDIKSTTSDTSYVRRRENVGRPYRKSNEFNENSQATNWENFPTQPPICGGNDGLPKELDGITFPKWRNESIKAYGNAIVPQVAYEIFKAINKII
tara:strand:- start:2 stop:976 length:975 start_codon:yes stop_codon:yes gene_type:complete